MSECPYSKDLNPRPKKPEYGCLSLEEELSFLGEIHTGKKLENRRSAFAAAVRQGAPAPLNSDELSAAGAIAWRNHSRCVGRLYWKSLLVRDHRDLEAPEAIY